MKKITANGTKRKVILNITMIHEYFSMNAKFGGVHLVRMLGLNKTVRVENLKDQFLFSKNLIKKYFGLCLYQLE